MMAMRRTRALFAALLIAAAASAQTSRPAPAAVEPLALVNANVVSVRDGTITANATIVLRNGRIDTVGTSAPPAGVKVLDLKGKYVLPGLIDAHTHADNFAAFRRALESGVTTVRSAGVSNYADVGFNTLVKEQAVARFASNARPEPFNSTLILRPSTQRSS